MRIQLRVTSYLSHIFITNCYRHVLTCTLGSQSLGLDLKDAPEWVIDMIVT